MKMILLIFLICLISCIDDEDQPLEESPENHFMNMSPFMKAKGQSDCSQFDSKNILKCSWYRYVLEYDSIQLSVLTFKNDETAKEYHLSLNNYPQFTGLIEGKTILILDGGESRYISEDMKRSASSLFLPVSSQSFLLNALPIDESENILQFSSYRLIGEKGSKVLKTLVLKNDILIAYSEGFTHGDFQQYATTQTMFHHEVGALYRLKSKHLALPIHFKERFLLLLTSKSPKKLGVLRFQVG